MYFISFSRFKRIRCRKLSPIMIPFRCANTDVSGVRDCVLRMSPCNRFRDLYVYRVNGSIYSSKLCIVVDVVFASPIPKLTVVVVLPVPPF